MVFPGFYRPPLFPNPSQLSITVLFELSQMPQKASALFVILWTVNGMEKLNKQDYIEKACCFDASDYTSSPDQSPCDHKIPVPQIIERLDGLFRKGMEEEAGDFLRCWSERAHGMGDWRGELSLLSELMGYYRRTADADAGLDVCGRGMEIIKEHGLANTVSGATVLLNAATTLKAFGKAPESLPIFEHVCRVYQNNLAPDDYRFGGLFNNMGLSYDDVENFEKAEWCFLQAMKTIEQCVQPEYELAVTCCNIAHMYDHQDPEDPRINEYMEKAWDYLNSDHIPRDSYWRFTASKCLDAFRYFGYFLYVKELESKVCPN